MYTHATIQSLLSQILKETNNLDGIGIHYLNDRRGYTIIFSRSLGNYYTVRYKGLWQYYSQNNKINFYRGTYLSPILPNVSTEYFFEEMETHRIKAGSLLIDLNNVALVNESVDVVPIQKLCLYVHEVIKSIVSPHIINNYSEIIYWHNDFAVKLFENNGEEDIDNPDRLNLSKLE